MLTARTEARPVPIIAYIARVILAKRRLFQLQYVTGAADVQSPPAVYRSFVSSLKIG